MCPVDFLKLNFIDELLQANYTAPSLQKHCEKAKNVASRWSLKNGLLKHQEQLAVAKKQNLQTQLITKAHTQVSMAHSGKNKTHKIISDCYYWPRMVMDINCYIQNCDGCYRSTILQDKTPGLLKPLPIPKHL